ncbi:MAG TPA: response regulator [Thermoanaerobaculia bacterium]|nr:response regulator [Thermoanaerobaculia bacterium]
MSQESSAPPRLLIVDDEATINFALWDYLVRFGFQVDRARTRSEAEALLAGEPYALAIIDLRLGAAEPRGGISLIRRVRERFPAARIILLTAYGSPEIEAEIADLGSDLLVLSKPQPLARLAEEVVKLLARRASDPCEPAA